MLVPYQYAFEVRTRVVLAGNRGAPILAVTAMIDWLKYRTDMFTWVSRGAIAAAIVALGWAWKVGLVTWVTALGMTGFVLVGTVVGIVAWRTLKPKPKPEPDVGAEDLTDFRLTQERHERSHEEFMDSMGKPEQEPPVPFPPPKPKVYDYIRKEEPAIIPDHTYWNHPVKRGSFWPYPYIWSRTVQPDGPHEIQNIHLKLHPFKDFKCRFTANSEHFNFAMVLMSFQPVASAEGYPFGLNGQTAFCVCSGAEPHTLELSVRYARLIRPRNVILSNAIQFELALQMMRTEAGHFYADMLINETVVLSHKVERTDIMGFRLVAWSTGQKTDIYLDQIQGNVMPL